MTGRRVAARGLAAGLLAICLLTVGNGLCAARTEMTIGVLAFRGEDDAIAHWSPTARYLGERLGDYRFRIEPLSLDGMSAAIREGRLDFILTNTGNYVVLENAFGISRLATLKVRHLGQDFTQFGAVIFTRRDRDDLDRLEDVAGHSMMAVSRNAFGGFQMAWRELLDAGVDPFNDLSLLRFIGFPQDDIVYSVLERRIDVGTVRSGTLERMAADGMIDLGQIKVLGARLSDGFPFLHSTRLYPEWPFAKARTTPEGLAQRVAVALLEMQPDSEAATRAFAAGWTIPLDYGPVHELFRQLQIGPYASLSKPSLASIWREFKAWIVFSLLLLLVLLALLLLLLRANRRISQSETRYRVEARERKEAQEALAAHQATLELRVEERTAELAQVNTSLRHSEATLRAIHDITTDPENGFEEKVEGLLLEGCRYFDMACAAVCVYRDGEVESLSGVCRDGDPAASNHESALAALSAEIAPLALPLAVTDLAQYFTGTRDASSAKLSGAALATAYRAGGEVVGFILYFDPRPRTREFSDVDIDILQLMAQWLGGEIERAEIHRRAQEHQTQLAHVARVNSMGELAAGIAHELNQPLTAILNYSNGCLRLLQRPNGDGAELRDAIVRVGNDARRAADIIKRLREFIRREDLRREDIAIRDCIETAIDLLGSRLKQQRIEIDISYAGDIGSIHADRIQIEQVVVNLLLNAIDALQDARLARKRIDIDVRRLDSRYAAVAISDTGRALEPEVAARLFDPFFTTKPEGMGMGLSISRSIVESHGGTIEYLHNDNAMPTIRFTLPLS